MCCMCCDVVDRHVVWSSCMRIIGLIRQDGNNNMFYQTQEDNLQGVLRRKRNGVQSINTALDMINATLHVVDAK